MFMLIFGIVLFIVAFGALAWLMNAQLDSIFVAGMLAGVLVLAAFFGVGLIIQYMDQHFSPAAKDCVVTIEYQ